jgi:hypothetical protein
MSAAISPRGRVYDLADAGMTDLSTLFSQRLVKPPRLAVRDLRWFICGHAFRHHRLESYYGRTSGLVWTLRFKVVIEHLQADRAGVALSAQRLEDGV